LPAVHIRIQLEAVCHHRTAVGSQLASLKS